MRRHFRWAVAACAGVAPGCGGDLASQPSAPPATTKTAVKFVAFDVSEPIVAAIKAGKILGTVAQDPIKIGSTGLRTAVAALKGASVERSIATGEVMVTPENLASPEVSAILSPPKVGNTSDAAPTGSARKRWKVVMIPKGTTHEFWQSVHAGAVKAAEEAGDVELTWQGPQKEDDRAQQIQLVDSAIASRADAIVLAPLDAKALVGPVERAVAKGIVVVVIDSGLASTKPVSTVATDNYHGGVLAARRLGEVMKGEGRVLLLRYAVGSESTEKREAGFTETMAKEFPKITYLSDDQYAGATADLAQKVSESLVTRYRGQIDGVFCSNESSTIGMMRALERAGLLTGSAAR